MNMMVGTQNSSIFICTVFLLIQHGQGNKIRLGAIFQEGSVETSSNDFSVPRDRIISSNNDASLFDSSIRESEKRSRLAFEYSISELNKQYQQNRSFTHSILQYSNGPDATFQIIKQVCQQLLISVAGIITSRDSDVVRSTCNNKQMPHIHVGESLLEDGNVEKDKMGIFQKYSLNMFPSMEIWGNAVSDLALHYKWRKIGLIYCGSIARVQPTIDVLSRFHGVELTILRLQVGKSSVLLETLLLIKERRLKRIIIDCNDLDWLLVILKKALELGVLGGDHHYILYGMNSHLLIERNQYVFGRCNITALRIFHNDTFRKRERIKENWERFLESRSANEAVNTKTRIFGDVSSFEFTLEVALMYDALELYASSLYRLLSTSKFRFNHRTLSCTKKETWLSGPQLLRSLKATNYTGITGPISFNEKGDRTNVDMDVVVITYKGLKKVGNWSSRHNNPDERLTIFADENIPPIISTTSLTNTSMKVTVIVEHPYVFKNTIINEDGSHEDVYTGYCIDLLMSLAADLGFSYEILEVPDHQYGDVKDGTWNGMIGELINGHADLAVAPLTITYDREKAVCFTKPYMSFGVSILFRTPLVGNPNLFGFLNPLSLLIWILVIIAYLSVALIMFCIARLSPYEWQDSNEPDSNEVENNFGILDSLWFGIGTLMQQGSDVNPKSISTRLLAGVWWFFILILISSYTANLAAFLTVTRMETEISSVDDLVGQSVIKYGTMSEGATAAFFRNSKLKVYEEMWRFLNQTKDVFVGSNEEGIQRVLEGNYAYLMESSSLEYAVSNNCNLTQVGGSLDTRGYGIATMKSSWRDELSVSVLKLQEKGILDSLKHKWWHENAAECSDDDTSSTQSLTVANLGGAFVFLCFGACVAVVVAIIEFISYAYLNARRKKAKFKSEVKLGLSTICSCRGRVRKTPFFDKKTFKESSVIELSPCICCSCVTRQNSKKEYGNQMHLPCTDHDETNKIPIKPLNPTGRYCSNFSGMIETVLSDHVVNPPHCSAPLPNDFLTSSVTSSKDIGGTTSSSSRGVIHQPYRDRTFDFSAMGSSFSLPECSPQLAMRNTGECIKEDEISSYFDNLPGNKELKNTSLKEDHARGRSEMRRWKFANDRSNAMPLLTRNQQYPTHVPILSYHEDTGNLLPPPNGGFVDFELRNLKQTIM